MTNRITNQAGNLHGTNRIATHTGSVSESEAIEFMTASEQWKAKTGRRYPTWSETFGIMKTLG